ncbi:MAG: hypothetical protein ACO2ZM_07220 [Francisellaceae bacterium]
MISELIIKNHTIYVAYVTNQGRLSSRQQRSLTEMDELREYFQRNDRLKLDACHMAQELIEITLTLPMAQSGRQRLLDELYPKLAQFLQAKVEK